jgi:hypothetical protein
MFVDMLLKILGENPAGYYSLSDKFGGIIGGVLFYSDSYLRFILFSVPWLWLIIYKLRGGKVGIKKFVVVIVISFLLGLIGFLLPWLIFEVMWGMTVRGLYGGQI